ncbi:hypothetical protein [Bordetella sp. FB-8]|uniref:hypothetical protein n=1 Tax=Bordetella sp. FB-8 TaxID=1159870 RepID=UPI000370704D
MRGIEAVQADTAFAFGRHTHAQFGVGLIHRGAQKSASARVLSRPAVLTWMRRSSHEGAGPTGPTPSRA